MKTSSVIFAILAATLTFGCDGEEAECGSSADCPSGLRCVDQTCITPVDGAVSSPCETDAECDDSDPCNGSERCGSTGCERGTALPDGAACDLDGDEGTREICLTGTCAPTRCGDGVLDPDSGEECDDGNDVDGDGCDSCVFTCTADATCDDGNSCNGAETCDRPSHTCVAGTNAADDTSCNEDRGRCVGGACLPRTCSEAAECSDGDACTGEEACEAMTCVATAPLDCDDGDDCTADRCDPSTGCSNELVDADGDGHASEALGACGDDCDDSDPTVFAGATDACDSIDNDCDGSIDEGGVVDWYPDCDGDGYAAAGAASEASCTEPPPALSGCSSGGGFTTRSPAGGSADCNDQNASVNPGQTMFQTTSISGAGSSVDFDYDCDGAEEKRFETLADCRMSPRGGCLLRSSGGWDGSVPECGQTGVAVTSCTLQPTPRGGSACTGSGSTRTQACR